MHGKPLLSLCLCKLTIHEFVFCTLICDQHSSFQLGITCICLCMCFRHFQRNHSIIDDNVNYKCFASEFFCAVNEGLMSTRQKNGGVKTKIEYLGDTVHKQQLLLQQHHLALQCLLMKDHLALQCMLMKDHLALQHLLMKNHLALQQLLRKIMRHWNLPKLSFIT
jgi:hypothetical protein